MKSAAVLMVTVGPPAPPVVVLTPNAGTAAKPIGLSVGGGGPVGGGDPVVGPVVGGTLAVSDTTTLSNSADVLYAVRPIWPALRLPSATLATRLPLTYPVTVVPKTSSRSVYHVPGVTAV